MGEKPRQETVLEKGFRRVVNVTGLDGGVRVPSAWRRPKGKARSESDETIQATAYIVEGSGLPLDSTLRRRFADLGVTIFRLQWRKGD
jgi:hypothetical protein